jgi:hypothetical protein
VKFPNVGIKTILAGAAEMVRVENPGLMMKTTVSPLVNCPIKVAGWGRS